MAASKPKANIANGGNRAASADKVANEIDGPAAKKRKVGAYLSEEMLVEVPVEEEDEDDICKSHSIVSSDTDANLVIEASDDDFYWDANAAGLGMEDDWTALGWD